MACWRRLCGEAAHGEVGCGRRAVDQTIAELGDWRGETLSRMRKLIKDDALVRAAVDLNTSKAESKRAK